MARNCSSSIFELRLSRIQYTPETEKAVILLQDIEVAGLALAASHALACAAPSPFPSGSSR